MASALFSFLEGQIRSQYVCYLVDKCVEEDSSKLNLARFRIKAVPSKLAMCTFLSKLSLDGNFLSSASINGLPSLKFLRYLTLNDNKLTQFPEELCQLKFVEFLNIGCNPIDELPEAIGKLKNLITLWCNDMLLEQLPETIGTLRKLKTFGARNNKLTALPESFGYLRRLKWLSLENNCISTLPDFFEELVNLNHLNLARNRFTVLPVEISLLKRLKFCSFVGNWIENITDNALEELGFIQKLLLQGNRSINGNLNSSMTNESFFELDILNENIRKDWNNSLPNSELNLLDTSEDEIGEDVYDFSFSELARLCVSA